MCIRGTDNKHYTTECSSQKTGDVSTDKQATGNRQQAPHCSALIPTASVDANWEVLDDEFVHENTFSYRDDESDNSKEKKQQAEFHNDNPGIPILHLGKAKEWKKSSSILRELLNPPPTKICTESPSRVQYNAAFIIDLGSVPADDIVADGNGKYQCDGVRRSVVQECDGSWKVASEVYAKYVPKESEKVLVKKYWVHRKHAGYSRRTFFLLDANHRIVNKVILLHYIFSGEEHCIELSSHGNSQVWPAFFKTETKWSFKVIPQNLEQFSSAGML